MSLYAALIAGLLWALSAGGAFLYGVETGDDRKTAEIAREEKVAAVATAAAASAAAHAISSIEVQHVTIRQKTDTVIREVPVYLDCRHDARVLRDINEARTGRAEPTGGGQLPAASAPGR